MRKIRYEFVRAYMNVLRIKLEKCCANDPARRSHQFFVGQNTRTEQSKNKRFSLKNVGVFLLGALYTHSN